MNLRALFAVPLVIAAAFWCCAVPASATVATSPEGATYTGEIKATAGLTELDGEAFSVSCKTSQITGSISTHGGEVTAGGSISTLDFGECSFPVTVVAGGSLEAHATSGGNGTVTSTGAKVTIDGPFGINCLYETSNTDIGTLTGGTTAKLDLDSSLIPRTGDSAFCGSMSEWTGSYTINTPDTFLLDAALPDVEGHIETSKTEVSRIRGKEVGNHVLEWTIDGLNGGMVCDKSFWETQHLKEEEPDLVFTPTFSECHTTGSATELQIKMNACAVEFFVAKGTNDATEQTGKLDCTVKPAEIVHGECKAKIPTQKLTGITYTKITVKEKHALTMDFKVDLTMETEKCGGAKKGLLEGSLTIEAEDEKTKEAAHITAI